MWQSVRALSCCVACSSRPASCAGCAIVGRLDRSLSAFLEKGQSRRPAWHAVRRAAPRLGRRVGRDRESEADARPSRGWPEQRQPQTMQQSRSRRLPTSTATWCRSVMDPCARPRTTQCTWMIGLLEPMAMRQLRRMERWTRRVGQTRPLLTTISRGTSECTGLSTPHVDQKPLLSTSISRGTSNCSRRMDDDINEGVRDERTSGRVL